MRFASLGSGSEGNALLIETAGAQRPYRILIDCGFGLREAQRRLARILVQVNYSRMPPFWHDPALNVPALPDLAPALGMARATDAAARGILRAHLQRGQNRLVWALIQARETAERATS